MFRTLSLIALGSLAGTAAAHLIPDAHACSCAEYIPESVALELREIEVIAGSGEQLEAELSRWDADARVYAQPDQRLYLELSYEEGYVTILTESAGGEQ